MNKKALHFTAAQEREVEEEWTLRLEAVQLLGVVVAEWNSDPKSAQCFDLRTISRAKTVTERLAELERKRPSA